MSVSELMALATALPGTKDVTAQFFSCPAEMCEVRDPEESPRAERPLLGVV